MFGTAHHCCRGGVGSWVRRRRLLYSVFNERVEEECERLCHSNAPKTVDCLVISTGPSLIKHLSSRESQSDQALIFPGDLVRLQRLQSCSSHAFLE